MSDDAPDTGDGLIDLVVFGAVTAVSVASGVLMGKVLAERFREKENDNREVER